VTTISFQVDDPELESFLDEQENRSEAIREAIRVYQWKQEGVQDSRLTDQQRVAYQWMLEQTDGGGRLSLEVAKTVLAQLLSLNSAIVKDQVFKPLQRAGYLRPAQYPTHVVLVVLAPSAVEGPNEGEESSGESSLEQADSEDLPGLSVDDPEKAGDRLDELAEAVPSRGD